MKVLLIKNDKIIHFGKFSGYDRTFDFIGNEKGLSVYENNLSVGSFKKKLIDRSLYPLYKQNNYGPFHNYDRYVEEYLAFKKALKIEPDIIHVTFGEDGLGYLAENKKKLPSKTKLVASIHQPPSWWKMTKKNIKPLQALDALVVLSNESKNYFEKFIPGKVHFIPHGVDTEFFCPSVKKQNGFKFHCLFVGSWLRDFSFFAETLHKLNGLYNNIIFDIVYPQIPDINHLFFQLLKYDNINWHRKVSDDVLVGLYQNSDVLFLPLIASTANNALLEAASSGLTILTSNSGGVFDYLPADLIYNTDNNIEKTINIFKFLIEGSRSLELYKQQVLLREIVKKSFDHKIVAMKINLLYKSLCAPQ